MLKASIHFRNKKMSTRKLNPLARKFESAIVSKLDVEDDPDILLVNKEKEHLLGSDKEQSLSARPPAIHRIRGMLGIGNKALPTVLNYRGGFVTSTNTAYTAVIGVNPAISGEASSFATLFDEMKCVGFKMEYTHMMIPGSSAAPNWSAIGVLAYDPTGSAPLSNVQNGWIHTRHRRLNLMKGIGLEQGISVSSNVYDPKFETWVVTFPKGTHTSSSGTILGDWVSTSDSTDVFGWIKPYFEAGGTGITYSFQYVLTFKMLYRSRS